MNKYKVTIKDVRENSRNLWSAGFCELQFLLRGNEPIAYTAGASGWNFDVYRVNGFTICTGYSRMPGRRINADFAKQYDKRAERIWNNHALDYDQQNEQVEKLLKEFCDTLREEQMREYAGRRRDNG